MAKIYTEGRYISYCLLMLLSIQCPSAVSHGYSNPISLEAGTVAVGLHRLSYVHWILHVFRPKQTSSI